MMKLAALYRYPVKSLGSEVLERVTLTAGRAMPGDRAFAITHKDSAFDPANPAWTPCNNFLRIVHIPSLSRALVAFDPETEKLRVKDGGDEAVYDLSAADGREALARWAGDHAGTIRSGPYTVAAVPGVSMSDSSDQAPSIMSLASLRDLSKRVGAGLDPRRFRGNLWIDGDGLVPWAEHGWAGREARIGAAVLEVIEPIGRCLATAADPATGLRSDNPMPAMKAQSGGEALFGVTARVVRGGDIAVGDTVSV